MTSFEVRILRGGCKQAKMARIFPDFRKSYRQYRMSGVSVRRAVWCALYDWDALDLELVEGKGVDGEMSFLFLRSANNGT
jgi:hypothetical protein